MPKALKITIGLFLLFLSIVWILIVFYGCNAFLDVFNQHSSSNNTSNDFLLKANITIIDATQTYFGWSRNFGSVELEYKIRNTGNVTINYGSIDIKVICKDGSAYKGYDNFINIYPNEEIWEKAHITTYNKQASEVVIEKVSFENNEHFLTHEERTNVVIPVYSEMH